MMPILLLAVVEVAAAHHHDGNLKVPEGHTVSTDPVDAILWIHIFLQMFTYGVLFPLGMVLGLVKSHFHVPCQITAAFLALLGTVLGHAHKGRQFIGGNVHERFGTPLQLLLLVQVVFGLYLKMHLEQGINRRIRPVICTLHSFVGKIFPILSWTQMLFGGITALGFCHDDHLGQCFAHFIMGSAFIGYGILLLILLIAGQKWLACTGRSQEFFDSATIAIWGCVNTFTEHRWGQEWTGNDWQHTTMGIIWWCAGLAGIWLSRDIQGRPQRNLVPGFVLVITGWAFGGHPQRLAISEKVHQMFGHVLMAAGITRIIEVAFLLKDQPVQKGRIWSWQYIPIYLLFAGGFTFMGATEEQLKLVALAEMDHVSYILIMFSMAFLAFLFINILVSIYEKAKNTTNVTNNLAYSDVPGGAIGESRDNESPRDVEQFELEGLTSDEEDRGFIQKQQNETRMNNYEGMASHGTLGKMK